MREVLSGEIGSGLVVEICHRTYGWTALIPEQHLKYRVFPEVTVRTATDETTRFGDAKMQHNRLDAVLTVEPGYRSLNRGQCFTVGMELKGSKADLDGDMKMAEYLGWTDYFFIACDSSLVQSALGKSEQIDSRRVGVFDITKGVVERWPERQEVSAEKARKLYEQIVINYLLSDEGGCVVTVKASLNNISQNDMINSEGATAAETRELSPEAREAEQERVREMRADKRQHAEEVVSRAQVLPERVRSILAPMSVKAQEVYMHIKENADCRAGDIEQSLNISVPAVRRHLAELAGVGLIAHEGAKKNGGYKILTEPGDLVPLPKCKNCILMNRLQQKESKDE